MAVDKTNIDWYKERKNVFDKIENKEDFERIIQELQTIQENLVDKKISIDKVKKELQKAQEQIRMSNIEQKNKDNIDQNFEKLYNNSEQNLEISQLNIIFESIISSLKDHINSELITLKWSIDPLKGRPDDVKKWIRNSDEKFRKYFADAAENEPSNLGRRAAKKIRDILNSDLT